MLDLLKVSKEVRVSCKDGEVLIGRVDQLLPDEKAFILEFTFTSQPEKIRKMGTAEVCDRKV
jgi:hypothetical protein